jgi:hypothetical protein
MKNIIHKIKLFYYKLFKIPHLDNIKIYNYHRWDGIFVDPIVPYTGDK